MTKGLNSNSNESSSNWCGINYFLLGGKKKFYSIGDREWDDLMPVKTRFIKRHSVLGTNIRTITPHRANCFRSYSIFIQ